MTELLTHSHTLVHQFEGDYGRYTVVPTDDGSSTLWCEKYQEHCHSLKGAYRETQYIYIDGCQILDKLALQDEVSILEVGAGPLLGFRATKEESKSLASPFFLKYVTLEQDEAPIKWAIKNFCDDEHIGNLQKSEYFGIPCYESFSGQFHLIVLLGNAHQSLNELALKCPFPYDGIYQDPFSPPKNPTLWTVEWFKLLKIFTKSETILSTYSQSTKARKSMLEAGWAIEHRHGFAVKSGSTLAYPSGKTPPVLLTRLDKSPTQAIWAKDLS